MRFQLNKGGECANMGVYPRSGAFQTKEVGTKLSVTVDTLMRLPIMQTGTQLLSHTGANNIVQYVTVVEVANVHFPNFGDGGFVLTTLSAYYDSLEKINAFVHGLCQVNVSAIGIKLGRFINELDPSTVALAAEHGVALITFPPTVYFREILSDTLGVITGNQRQTLNQINNVNSALIDAILQNGTPQDILDILCREIECYCCCLDPAGKKIAESSSLHAQFDIQGVRQALQYFFHEHPERNKSYYRAENIFIFPCVLQAQLLAAFCIVVSEPALDVVIPLSQAIVSGISIKFLEANLKAQAERELVSSMLDDILFSNKSNAKTVAERLELLSFVPRKHHLIILLSCPVIARERGWLHTMDSIQRVFGREFPSAIAFKRGSEYIVLVAYDQDTTTAKVQTILESCQALLSQAASAPFDLGCSTPVPDLSQMSEYYLQAKKAVQFGRMVHDQQHVFLYGNYFELGLISCGAGSSEAQIFFHRIINPVLAYDRQAKTELWATLEQCFLHDKLEQIATVLHIHISTLRYRLQKIEGLTGYSYFDSHHRMTLNLAYLLYKTSPGAEDRPTL